MDCLVPSRWTDLRGFYIDECPLCKQTLACTNHSEGGEQFKSPWRMSCIVWEYESPCSPIKPILFPFTASAWRSPSLFFFCLVSAPTTSCVSVPQSRTRLTRQRHVIEELRKMFARGYREAEKWCLQGEKRKVRNEAKRLSWKFTACIFHPVRICVCVLERLCMCVWVIHEPWHACNSCVYVCVLKCVCRWVHSYEQRDQRAVLWGRKGSDSKIEYELSSAASLSICCTLCTHSASVLFIVHFSVSSLQFKEPLCISGRWKKRGSYAMLLEMLECD